MHRLCNAYPVLPASLTPAAIEALTEREKHKDYVRMLTSVNSAAATEIAISQGLIDGKAALSQPYLDIAHALRERFFSRYLIVRASNLTTIPATHQPIVGQGYRAIMFSFQGHCGYFENTINHPSDWKSHFSDFLPTPGVYFEDIRGCFPHVTLYSDNVLAKSEDQPWEVKDSLSQVSQVSCPITCATGCPVGYDARRFILMTKDAVEFLSKNQLASAAQLEVLRQYQYDTEVQYEYEREYDYY